MPVYEYRCPGCGHCFEKLGPISTRQEEVSCPTCGSPRAQRLISLVVARTTGAEPGQSAGGCCRGGGGGCACRG
jgi:putative FmdB family regulatory protein